MSEDRRGNPIPGLAASGWCQLAPCFLPMELIPSNWPTALEFSHRPIQDPSHPVNYFFQLREVFWFEPLDAINNRHNENWPLFRKKSGQFDFSLVTGRGLEPRT